MDYKEKCLQKIKELTKCKNVRLTKRGNSAILQGLKIAKSMGYKKVLIPNQGGWLTYRQYPKRLGLEQIELNTDNGLILLDDLSKYKDSILLIASFAGYAALQDIKSISQICKKNNLLFIEDVSGVIGIDKEKYADIIVSSFGDWKPVNLGYGGCIASDLKLDEKDYEMDWDFKKLYEKLSNANKRLDKLMNKSEKVKNDMKKLNIKVFHDDKDGLVVITEKNKKVSDYCKENNLEFTLCPRYIRLNKEAISIEIKRLDY